MVNLKNLRLKRGYSQSQLASFLNVGAGVVARWESQQTQAFLPQVIKLCRILNCKPAQFYCTDDSAKNNNQLSIPVFSENNPYITRLPRNCTEDETDFGIVLSWHIADRLCAGDVCYFTIQKNAVSGSIVMVSNDSCSFDIVIYDENNKDNIIAVCTAVRCMI